MDTTMGEAEANGTTPMVEASPAAEAEAPAPEAAAAKESTPAPAPNPDLDAYNQHFSTVQQDPTDFTTWTQLLTSSEKLSDLERVRAAYDAFLAEYPLCYGYWKKYADVEARNGDTERALQVYERGVAATPYSADLWAHYAAFKKGLPDFNPEDVRGVYERGLAYCGTDYNAHSIWDKYFSFEQEQASTLHTASLFSRVLACPIKELDRYYTSFKNYVHSLTAEQLILPDEYASMRAKLEAEKEAAKPPPAEAKPDSDGMQVDVKKEEANGDEAVPGADDEAPPGETVEAPPGEAPAPAADVPPGEDAGEAKAPGAEDGAAAPPAPKEEAPKPEEPLVSDDEVKAAWVKSREGTYETAKQELLKRKPFEDAIRRPYFHVKPLDGVQLFNWVKYLEFTEARGDHAAMVLLFERCLVPCANYPEFWQRYVRYLEKAEPAAAKAALDRAVLGFCKRHPELHLFAARFDEKQGDVDGARARYKHLLQTLAPRMLEAVTAAANFERRQGNQAAAIAYLEELLTEERSKEGSKLYSFLTIHYASFVRKHFNDVASARKVLDEALEAHPGVRSLWEAAIHMEEQIGGPEAVKRAMALFEKCTAPPPEGASSSKLLSDREREELSARAVDFADMYGDAETLYSAQALHAQRFMLPASVTADARAAAAAKRPAETAAGAAAAKAAKSDAAAAPATAAAASAAGAVAAAALPVAPMAAAAVPPAAPYGYPPAGAAPYPYYGYGQYPGYTGYPGYGYQ